jgi:surface polysaccharide O-acyltransferase-like enzyme
MQLPTPSPDVVIERRRYHGFDYLRAIFSICVVGCHLGYVAPSAIFDPAHFGEHRFTPSDFINFYVLTLAVPVFFLISAFLFLEGPADWPALKRFLIRIGRIAVFWIVLFILFREQGWIVLYHLPRTAQDLGVFIISGGSTLYYFFVSLLGVVALTYFARRLDVRVIALLFVASILVLALLPIVAIRMNFFPLTHYYDPLNFLPYPFAALLIASWRHRTGASLSAWHVLAACVATVALATLDWTVYVNAGLFQTNEFAIPAYTRPALVTLAMGVVWAGSFIRREPGRVVSFMSRNSLALYCVHPFLVYIIRHFPPINFWLALAGTVLLSYAIAAVARRFLQPDLLS